MINQKNYQITRENLPIHEMMGLPVKIVQSKDSGKVGMEGKIVDETQRMFVIETTKGEVHIPKNENTFQFTLENETVEIEGKNILYSPIERLKNGGKILYG